MGREKENGQAGAASSAAGSEADEAHKKPLESNVTSWVYMLQCADGTLYAGWTTDVERRVRQHNAGSASKYTRSRRPVTCVYREPAADKSCALCREAAIKRLSRASKLRLIAQRQAETPSVSST